MKFSISSLLWAVMLAVLVPSMVLTEESTELYLNRFSLFGWIGGGGGSQTLTIEHLLTPDESSSFSAAGINGGGGFAYNNLFNPNLRIGLALEGQYLKGYDDDITIETSTVIPKLMLSYIYVTSVGGVEPGVFFGSGLATICQSGGDSEDDCDNASAGEVGASLYWTPSTQRSFSLGADFRYIEAENIFDNEVESYIGMVNARYQFNFGD